MKMRALVLAAVVLIAGAGPAAAHMPSPCRSLAASAISTASAKERAYDRFFDLAELGATGHVPMGRDNYFAEFLEATLAVVELDMTLTQTTRRLMDCIARR